ncbi:uncharacterized protein LOC126464603 [Schistocerca serialis cubense]|uniref:uncharacterized protein LOC126464603 n=1 Tax=Schistocerca serialis cubense TaxID=2023355 RepID=UPI00214E74E4|nr:uncharacterized protein LOC126464603 [Schistocerca serialis cubense]
MKSYKIQLLQALCEGDRQQCEAFCNFVLGKLEDDSFLPHLVFSDEGTFHLNGKMNHHNVSIWGIEQPHEVVQHERDSPKFHVFCAVSQKKLEADLNDSPPHWKLEVQEFLNQRITEQWISCTGPNDSVIHYWPPRSPDLTECDYFLWGFIKGSICMPPLPTSVNELRHHITAAVEAVTQYMVTAV